MSATNRPSNLQQFELLPGELSGKVANGVGIVAPFDFALDAECARWLPKGTPMFVTRTPELQDPSVTVELARLVSSELSVAPAVGSLLAVQPAAIGYACTSGSFVEGRSGEAHLQEVITAAGANAATTTSGALIDALKMLNVKKVALVTPYNQELTQLLIDFLAEFGVEVVSAGYLDMERDIARISQTAVRRIAQAVDRPEAEAIFFSCTNLHTFDVIAGLERQLDKAVLSANQVTMWATLRAGGLAQPNLNQRLFKRTRLRQAARQSKLSFLKRN